MNYYDDPLVTLLHGDCIEVMATLPADSVDAVVTDPPYGLEFMGKEWDSFKKRDGNPFDPSMAMADNGRPRSKTDPWATERTGYGAPKKMPKCGTCGKWQYNGTKSSQCSCDKPVWILDTWTYPRKFQAWCEIWARAAWRVTKPGGYLLSFGGTRTHHRLVCALEDAGWIIRDELTWIYASGFPKSKANLKPAHEPIVLARKPGPLRPLAIDECRIGMDPTEKWAQGVTFVNASAFPPGSPADRGDIEAAAHPAGRWPSNVLLSDPELFDEIEPGYSRFFIVPKADRAERERGLAPGEKVWSDGREKAADYPSQRGATARANVHPTVKPIDLMRHLVRLVTPTRGTVLDPFLGSGTTCLAASEEGLRSIGIEREAEYLEIAKGRLMATPMGLGLDVPAPLILPPEEVA
jgi:DNA modification methylase